MAFADPEHNVTHLHLAHGMKVADFGAGTGFYAFALAKRVGGTGRVFAIDVQKDLLSRLKNDARKRGIYNIEIIWSNFEQPAGAKLATHSVDAVVLSNVLHQAENKITFLNEARRVLKAGGEMLVVDWVGSATGIGPKHEHVFPERKARELIESLGFTLEHSFNAGDHHYGLIYKK